MERDRGMILIGIVANGHVPRRFHLPFQTAGGLGWSPDGPSLLLAAGQSNNGGLDVYTVGADGRHLRRLTVNMGASKLRCGSGSTPMERSAFRHYSVSGGRSVAARGETGCDAAHLLDG